MVHAARSGCTDVVKMLHEFGVDVNQQDKVITFINWLLVLGHHEYIACFPSPNSEQTGVGGRWLVIQLTYQFDYLTALLEYLNLKGARLSSRFSKSKGTSTS